MDSFHRIFSVYVLVESSLIPLSMQKVEKEGFMLSQPRLKGHVCVNVFVGYISLVCTLFLRYEKGPMASTTLSSSTYLEQI